MDLFIFKRKDVKMEKKAVKGYKVLNKDMSSAVGEKNTEVFRDVLTDKMNEKIGEEINFKLGQVYTTESDCVPCKNGFHFCKKIEDLNCCYEMFTGRIFEIEAYEVKNAGKRGYYVATTIKMVRELGKDEIIQYFNENKEKISKHGSPFAKMALANYGFALETLVVDSNEQVRRSVAEQGYGLNILISDTSPIVRRKVAEQGYHLEILVNDESPIVRMCIAHLGYGMDILINDKDSVVQGIARNLLAASRNEERRIRSLLKKKNKNNTNVQRNKRKQQVDFWDDFLD